MNTILQNESPYYLNSDFDFSDDARQNLIQITEERFNKMGDEVNKYFFYILKVTYTPSRINYHKFNFEKIQDISRKFSNGMIGFGGTTNRKFFKKYFIGGVRTLSINQELDNEFPSFSLNYLLFSDEDNLDVKLINQLKIRLKLIDTSLVTTINYLGKYKNIDLTQVIDSKTDLNDFNQTIKKLGTDTINEIYNNQFQRPRFLGKLFSLK